MRRCLAIATALVGCTWGLFAQQPKVLAPHKLVPPRIDHPKPWPKPATLRSMVGGLWMTDANFKSSIYLRNNVEVASISAVPILYLSNGAKYVLPSVMLEPSGTAVLNINDALRDKSIAPWATLVGYVEVQYTSFYDPLCVVVNSIDTVHSLIFTSALRPTALPPHHSETGAQPAHIAEGLWWKEEANVTGLVALSNGVGQAVRARVQISDSQGRVLGEHAITISPHGTKLVKLEEMQWAQGSTGGLRVIYDGPEDGLIINGQLEDAASGYSASIPIRVPLTEAEHSSLTSFAELGLMTGAADPMMSFPSGTVFTPFSVVRNIASETVSVVPSIYWMEGGKAHSAQLRQFRLLPYQTVSLNVQSLLSSAGLDGFNGSINLILEVQGKPHSLLMASGSVDQKKTYVFQVIPHSVQESASKTLSYWSTGNGDDTMVTLWNPADEAQDFVFTLFFSGGKYDFPIHLEPRATHIFNLSEIIQNQVPDRDGNIIPATVHEGSARISGPQDEVQHILAAMDAGTYNVRKATCSYYCITCDGYIDAALGIIPFAVATGGTKQLNVTAYWDGGTQYNLNNVASWSSNNSGVATVTKGSVKGVASGAATISGFANEPVEFNYCAYDPMCPPNNQNIGGSGGGTVLFVTISIRSSGTAASDDSARDAYNSMVGRYGLGAFVDTGGFCTIGYEAAGTLAPSSYTGTVTLVRTKGGVDYKGSTGQTVDQSFATGTNDTSGPTFEDTNPHSGTSNGVVYDLDAPGRKPATNEIWRKRMNFFENAQLPDGSYVANEVGFYVRLSCKWGSGGNTFATGVAGDNVLNLGTTKTSWNLQ